VSRNILGDEQPRFDGGLNTVSDDAFLLPTQMRRAENARLTDFGAVSKRGGTQRTSTDVLSPNAVQGGYDWRKDDGTGELLAVANGVLYTATFGSFPITWTAESGTLSTTVLPTFAQFRDGAGDDVVYIADGGLLNKWDGTTLTTNIANTNPSRVLTVHNERLWGCGCGTFPDSIFYSALNNGDTFGNGSAGGGQIIVRTFGDEVVVGLASVGSSLLIFHRRGISRLTGFGQDDTVVAPSGVTSDVGTIAANSIAAFDNIAFFISERGLYRCNESEVAPVGTPDRPDPLLPILRRMTASQLEDIRCVLNRATRELWAYLPGYGVYTYHTLLGAWAGPWDGAYVLPEPTALWEATDDEGLPIVLKGDSAGWVSMCDAMSTNKDNVEADGTGGTNVAMTVQMHRFYCGDDAESKALRWGYLTAQFNGSTLSRMQWATGPSAGTYALPSSTTGTWGGAGTEWGTGTWGGSGSVSYRIPMGGAGYYVDVTFVDSSTAIPVLSRFKLETFGLGRR
jgi:hypothetical protein